MTGKEVFILVYSNYHVIEYSYELTNFYKMLKSTMDTPFRKKRPPLLQNISTIQNHLKSSKDDIVMQECLLPDFDRLRLCHITVSLFIHGV